LWLELDLFSLIGDFDLDLDFSVRLFSFDVDFLRLSGELLDVLLDELLDELLEDVEYELLERFRSRLIERFRLDDFFLEMDFL
jgi:hypothetical protein